MPHRTQTGKSIAAIRKRNELELEGRQLQYEAALIGAQESYKDSKTRMSEIEASLAENQANREAALKRADAYREYGNALLDLENKEKSGLITAKDKRKEVDKLKKAYGDLINTSVVTSDQAERAMNRELGQASGNYDDIIRLSTEMNNLKTQQNEAQKAALNLADIYADKLPDAMSAADGSAERLIDTLVHTTRGLGVDNEISQQIALAKNGFEDLQGAIDAGKLTEVISDYKALGSRFGMTSAEIAAGQSLIQNGFTNIYDAILKSPQAFDAVQLQFKDLSVQAHETSESMTEAGRSFGIIGQDESFQRAIAGGKEFVETLDGAGKIIEAFNQSDGISFKINGSGGVDVLNMLGETVQSLADLGATELKLNIDTGGLDVFPQAVFCCKIDKSHRPYSCSIHT